MTMVHHLKGKPKTPEQRRKISEALRAYWKALKYNYPPPVKEKKIRIYSEEHKKRMVEGIKKKWADPVFRERMRPKPGKHPWKMRYKPPREDMK